jgi:DNA topoisomerase I
MVAPNPDKKHVNGNAVDATMPHPAESAREAGLRYVSDTSPGITRKKKGKGFIYVDADGKTVKDAETLGRIRSLAIPPAWTEVWICPRENGHIQATGRDARGRKQFRYHPKWHEVRDETKFNKMLEFARALPGIRRATQRHLKLKGLPREKVLAAVVALLEKTLIRVGNEEYAKNNDHYGLTTLQDDHVEIRGGKVRFEFTGKSGIERQIDLQDRHLAKVVSHCQDLPGEDLFQYIDEAGNVVDVTSTDVNAYLREITGQDFTAKDFRTWAGTVLAATALSELASFDSQAQAKKNVVSAVERVAERLGNTKSVCRKCYIHPQIISTYMDGAMAETVRQQAEKELKNVGKLKPEEAAVVGLLQQKMKSVSRKGRKASKGEK